MQSPCGGHGDVVCATGLCCTAFCNTFSISLHADCTGPSACAHAACAAGDACHVRRNSGTACPRALIAGLVASPTFSISGSAACIFASVGKTCSLNTAAGVNLGGAIGCPVDNGAHMICLLCWLFFAEELNHKKFPSIVRMLRDSLNKNFLPPVSLSLISALCYPGVSCWF